MLFDKRPKFENLNWTERKIKTIESRPKRQQEKLQGKYPLLADQIQPPAAVNIDEELIRREVMATQIEQEWRDRVAKSWRTVRADYYVCSKEMRAEIIAYWRIWRGPRSASNFGYIVEQFNGVAEAKRQRFKEDERAMYARIIARISNQNILPF